MNVHIIPAHATTPFYTTVQIYCSGFATLPVYMHLFVVHEGGGERERERTRERERERERQRRVTSSWGEIKKAEAARAHNGFANESTFR